MSDQALNKFSTLSLSHSNPLCDKNKRRKFPSEPSRNIVVLIFDRSSGKTFSEKYN